VKDGVDPVTPKWREATDEQDLPQTPPVDGIEGFGEVQLQDQSRRAPFEAALHHLSSVDEVFRDAPTHDEPGYPVE
jgi:hypothetical protein